jgi:hypothetical protein
MAQFRVIADGLNLREGPSPNNIIKTELFANSVVEKLDESVDRKWFKVSAGKNGVQMSGWVASRFLVPIEANVTTPTHLADAGWIEKIGEFDVIRKEIPRPGNKPYFNNSHTMIGVLHTTESDTVSSAFHALSASHSAPHFIAGEDSIVQCRPITKQAAALLSSPSYNPNTDAALQIEMVSRSKEKLWMPADSSLRPVIAIMRWASKDPLDIPLQRPVETWVDDCADVPPIWAKSTNKRRLAKEVWPKAKGWYMHLEVPVNNHWDCGALRIREMLALASQI